MARKNKQTVNRGRFYIRSTFNNTLITVTDAEGNVLGWASAGSEGFKGSRKGTAYAAQVAAESACQAAKQYGMGEVEIFSQGPGSGKDSAIRTINNKGMKVNRIKDVTPVPHNGCRPKKRRRG